MSAANLIGPIVDGWMVEDAIVEHLNAVDAVTGGTWISTALAELERAHGLPHGKIERPRGVVNSRDFAKWPEDQLPCIVVISAGLAREPELRADNTYEARWLVGLAPVVGDADDETVREIALLYGAAVRWATLARPSLGGFATDTLWRDEKYDDLDRSRSIAASRIVFEVVVERVVQRATGLPAPLADPEGDPGGLADAQRPFEVEVQPIPISEAVTA